jgi:dephospho-CoA kinase
MRTVVLTGGIGSGKSFASEFMGERGALVIDLDQVAGRTLVPGSRVLGAVAKEFGPGVLHSDGSLDRAELARVCFVDSQTAGRLDAIVHPEVELAAVVLLDDLRVSEAPPEVVVVEVPLLAEAPQFAALGDFVVAITAPESVRVERAVARGGMERSDIVRRARVQAPDAERIALADVVIKNAGTLDEFREALGRFWDRHLGVGSHDG